MKMLQILNDNHIDYRFYQNKKNQITLRFNRQAQLIISHPKRVEFKEIERIINANIDWIKNEHQKIANNFQKFEDNAPYTFLGKTYFIKVVTSRHKGVFLQDDKIIIYTDNHQDINKTIDIWRQEQADTIFNEILYQVFEKMKEVLPYYPKLMIKKYKSRWGCCYYKKKLIILNISLINVPLHLIQYVITHELAHLCFQNHQNEFHDLVRKYYPNEKNALKELKQYHCY